MNNMYQPNNQPAGPPAAMPYGPAMPGMMSGGGGSLFDIFWRSWWLILFFALLGGGGAYLYLRKAEPAYTSVSQVLIEKPGGPQSSQEPWEPGVATKNLVQTQAILMASPEIVTRAMSDPNNPEMVALLGMRGEDYVRGILRTLSAKPMKDADIVTISASAAEPNHAAVVVNAVVEAYTGWLDWSRDVGAADLLRYLNEELEKQEDALEDAFRLKDSLEKRNPQLASTGQTGGASEEMYLLREELANARQVATERQSYFAGLSRYAPDPNDPNDPNESAMSRFRMYVYTRSPSGVGDDGTRNAVKKELHDIQSQLAMVKGNEIPGKRLDHLKMEIERLEKREGELEEQIRELDREFVRNHISLARSLAEEASEREKLKAAEYESELTALEELTGDESAYAQAVIRCELAQRRFNSLIEQIDKVNPDSAENLKVRVIARAGAAEEPSSPQTERVLGIGLVLGLMAGGGLAFIRDMRDQRVRSADEITAILGVPVLGAIPTISRRGMVRRGQRVRFATNSRESEAYRAVRTALLYGAPREHGTVVLVTSPGPLEGKTTLVSNLAIAMAQAGQKTLIIDADLRKPSQHRVFAKQGHGKGLVDLLTGAASPDEVIRPTEVEGLDVLESGRADSHPSELFNSDRLANLLDHLKGRYNRILVDSPPVGVVSDAQILATMCSLTLLVLRAERSSRPLTMRARDALMTVQARVAGAVVNDVSKRDHRYSHYSTHSYHYGKNGSVAARDARKQLSPGADGTERGEPPQAKDHQEKGSE